MRNCFRIISFKPNTTQSEIDGLGGPKEALDYFPKKIITVGFRGLHLSLENTRRLIIINEESNMD